MFLFYNDSKHWGPPKCAVHSVTKRISPWKSCVAALIWIFSWFRMYIEFVHFFSALSHAVLYKTSAAIEQKSTMVCAHPYTVFWECCHKSIQKNLSICIFELNHYKFSVCIFFAWSGPPNLFLVDCSILKRMFFDIVISPFWMLIDHELCEESSYKRQPSTAAYY